LECEFLTSSQQFGGINALNYYFPTILEDALGMSELMARILTGCNATSYAISSAMAFWMVDGVGRRSLMMNGAFFQFVAYVMVAISVALLSHAPSQVSLLRPFFQKPPDLLL
jgi:MFS family permease